MAAICSPSYAYKHGLDGNNYQLLPGEKKEGNDPEPYLQLDDVRDHASCSTVRWPKEIEAQAGNH